MWMLFIILYGIFKGSREIFKKKAFEKLSVMETLYMYTFISLLFALPAAPSALSMDYARYLLPVIIKAFVIFIAWLAGFTAVKNMPVSFYGIIDLSRVLFSTGLGVLVLGERLGVLQIAGLILVCTGLGLLKVTPKKREIRSKQKEQVSKRNVILAFVCCFLNAVSGTMDKALLDGGTLTSNQLLFWYNFFLVLFYTLYIIATKTKIDIKKALKTPYLYLMAFTLVLGDKVLFMANADPQSTVGVMTLLKQVSCVIIILGGRFVFKEKRTAYKLFCAGIVIAGIVLAAA